MQQKSAASSAYRLLSISSIEILLFSVLDIITHPCRNLELGPCSIKIECKANKYCLGVQLGVPGSKEARQTRIPAGWLDQTPPGRKATRQDSATGLSRAARLTDPTFWQERSWRMGIRMLGTR